MGKIKRVADAAEPPVVIPIVVVPVDIHVALVVPTVEGGQFCIKRHLCHCPSNSLETVPIL